MASWCFQKHLGNAGGYAVSLSMILFAFATIIAWYYLGSQALLFLIGRLGWKNGKNAAALYRFLYLGAVCMGCVAAMEKVWLFSDIVNGLLSLPNLLALVLLVRRVEFPGRFPADSPPARGETKKRPAKERRGILFSDLGKRRVLDRSIFRSSPVAFSVNSPYNREKKMLCLPAPADYSGG